MRPPPPCLVTKRLRFPLRLLTCMLIEVSLRLVFFSQYQSFFSLPPPFLCAVVGSVVLIFDEFYPYCCRELCMKSLASFQCITRLKPAIHPPYVPPPENIHQSYPSPILFSSFSGTYILSKEIYFFFFCIRFLNFPLPIEIIRRRPPFPGPQ